MTTLLRIRSIQIKRDLNVSNLSAIFILIIFSVFVLGFYQFYQTQPNCYYITFLIFSACAWLQTLRKDRDFIYNHIENPHLEVYLEYACLTLPFSLPSLFTSNWFCFPLLLGALIAVPYFRIETNSNSIFKNISKIISASNFELISGFRKSYSYLIPLYIVALAMSWFRVLPLFILWLITTTIVSFYNECEPLNILNEGMLSPKQFLKRKMLQHSKYLFFLYGPILIINSIFNPEYLLITILFFPLQIATLCFAICLKYASYKPSETIVSNNVILSIASIASALPHFLLIPLCMAFYYYKKAKINLKLYLND